MTFTQCRLCPSQEKTLLFRKEGLPIVRCRRCGVVFADHNISAEERRSLYTYYKEDRGENGQPISPLTQRRYKELLRFFSSYRREKRLLEVGCGRGYFLEEARSEGWEALGTEFSAEASLVARSKGLEVSLGELSHSPFSPGTFDVVVLIEVLEHMEEPLEEMGAAFRLLRPGGLLYLTTPNFNSLTRQLLGKKWRIFHAEHRFYFTPLMLDTVLKRIGFKRLSLFSKNLSLGEWWHRGVRGESASNDRARSLDESLRQRLAKRAMLRGVQQMANLFLRFSGGGDTLEAYYEKPLSTA